MIPASANIALKFELRLLIHQKCNDGFVLFIQLRGYLHEVFHSIEQVLQLVKGEDVRLMAGRTLINFGGSSPQ